MGQDLPHQRCADGGRKRKRICESTNGIDRWFIYQIQKICDCEKEIAKYDLDTLPMICLREAKIMLGFSDEQISRIMQHGDEEDVYERKEKQAALPGYLKWWIPAVQSLKQRHLISILLLKIGTVNEVQQ
jgi:hypothetical protein